MASMSENTFLPEPNLRRQLCVSLLCTTLPGLAAAQVASAGAATAPAASPPTLKVTLADGSSRSFTLAELQALPPESATVQRRDGGSFVVKGVSVTSLLKLAGLDLSQKLGVQTVVGSALVARAADGYRAVFGLALADPHFGPSSLMVTWSREDGSALAPNAGPLQLIHTTEPRTARWVRQLVALEVKAL
jgi:hypothetical protein